MIDREAVAADVAATVTRVIRSATMDSARSQQSAAHLVGMSDMGGCREYLRLTVLETPFDPVEDEEEDLNLASFIGTAFGDRLESMMPDGYQTQVPISLDLPNGLSVSGTCDILNPAAGVWDGKTTKHYASIRRHGPDDAHLAQISGYLVGAAQMGLFDEGVEPYAALVYFDRLGTYEKPLVHVITLDEAKDILWGDPEDSVQGHLEQVIYAVQHDEVTSRDRPEAWCKIACPYYQTCYWGATDVNQIIDAPDLLQAVDDVLAAKAMEKEAKALKAAGQARLAGVNGSTRRHLVRWITVNGSETRAGYERLDLREIPRPASPDSKEKTG